MPAKKAARAQERRRIVNRRVRSSMRTAVKKAVRALNTNSDAAGSAVLTAVSKLDRASSKGIIHRNAVARSKSRLTRRLNAISAE